MRNGKSEIPVYVYQKTACKNTAKKKIVRKNDVSEIERALNILKERLLFTRLWFFIHLNTPCTITCNQKINQQREYK
jgi:hypothetical protein